MREEVLKALDATKLVAIIRGMDPEVCVRLADAYQRGGIRLVEVTFDQTGDPEKTVAAIRAIRANFAGRLHVGAGTVLTAAQLKAVADVGGEFMVTPSVNPELIRQCVAAGLVAMPGAFTPSEIVTAHEAGADIVKIFPVRSLGPQYVKDVLAPLKHIRLMAVGGVSPDNAADYLRAGCVGVGASGSLVNREWIRDGAWDRIAAEAARFIAACKMKL